MPMPTSLSAFFRRWRRLLLVLAGVYALWILAGFFLVPALVRPRLEREAARALKRPVAVAKLRFNPFTFGVTVEGLRVGERGGGDWITLRRLYVNYDIWRLLRHTVAFSTIQVEGLTFRASLDAKGQLNFQDLIEEEDRPEEAPASKGPSWVLDVRHFALREGRVEFRDRSEMSPFQTVVGPIAFTLEGLRTEVGHRSGVSLEAWTEAKEHLVWKGDLGFQPFASRGSLLLENLSLPKYRPYEQEQVSTEIRSGTAAVRSQYRVEWGKGRHGAELSDLELTLKDVALAERGAAEPALELPLLEVRGGRMDLLAPSLELGSIHAEQGVVRIQRGKENGLNLARLFRSTKPQAKKEDEKPFRLLIHDLTLHGFRLGWEDLGLARPVKVEATDLDLRWQELSLDPAATSRASLAFKLGGGSLQVDGSLAPLKASGELTVKAEALELGPWDPYLDSDLDLRVASGKLGVDGRLRFAFEGRKSDGLSFLGGASVQGLEARDAAQNEPFLRWRQLRISGADLRTAPLSVAVQAVAWTEPEGRLVVQPDGSTNVARALRLEQGAKAPVAASALPATPASTPDIAIARLAISGGRLSFIDRSVQPNAALALSDLEGSYLGLSSHPEASSKVDFRGRAGGLAPITIQGHAMPLRNDLDTDVILKIQDADLTDFTPYTGKYLGYTVKKGKLDVDAHLRIDHRNLKAENAVKLDQFYLGEKVPSPEATGLPVKLGLAILRDRRGVIAFDLPIEGSLDDPDVKYGQLVWKAIFGLLGKIAASPFTLIGKLFGGDAGDLSSLAFAPGSSALDGPATAKLQALAKALQERPELRLEAEGSVDADQDGGALRRAGLEALLGRTRARILNSAEATPVPAAERERWIRAAYGVAFPAPKEAKGVPLVPPPPPAEMEQRLLGSLKVDPADLAQLADARAKGTLAWLLDTAKADPERVFQVQTGQAKGPVVAFNLK